MGEMADLLREQEENEYEERLIFFCHHKKDLKCDRPCQGCPVNWDCIATSAFEDDFR